MEELPDSTFESNNYPLIPNKGNLNEKDLKTFELNLKLRSLDYERIRLINYFSEAYNEIMTKKQIEKEINELYNEPYRYFK
jgi:uncharacterized protein YdgA (DUF945 family)